MIKRFQININTSAQAKTDGPLVSYTDARVAARDAFVAGYMAGVHRDDHPIGMARANAQEHAEEYATREVGPAPVLPIMPKPGRPS